MSLNALEIRVTSAIGNAIFVIIYDAYKKRPPEGSLSRNYHFDDDLFSLFLDSCFSF